MLEKPMWYGAVLVFLLSLVSCGSKGPAAIDTMEEIYREQGIPVTTRIIESTDFSTFLTFTSVLRGFRESTGSSMISDTVDEVLVEVGDYVEKNQPIVLFPRTNPVANYYQALAAYESSEQTFRRIEALYNSNSISRQQYDDAKTRYEVQLANWKAVNDMVEVKAPLSGYVTGLTVHPADNVHPGDNLFTISNYDRLSSVVWVTDNEISHIRSGQQVVAEWKGHELKGSVIRVDLSKDIRMKAFASHILVENNSHVVPSGITADINIVTSLTGDAVVLHRREYLTDNAGHYVYLEKNGKAVRQHIDLGLRQGLYCQVVSGLTPGDELIIASLPLVREGSLVRKTVLSSGITKK